MKPEPHPQLADIARQLTDTERRLQALATEAGPDRWRQRPAPGAWSPSECVQHLIATIDAFLPLIDARLDAAPPPTPRFDGVYRTGVFGRLLLWVVEPPYRVRARTSKVFVPDDSRPMATDLADFAARHEAIRERLARAEGYPLDRLTIVSPFDRRVSYSLFTTFRIVPTHERRHLWQAEQALQRMTAR